MRGKYIFGTVGIAALCTSANLGAEPASEQYGQIPARNLFGLHEPVVQTNEPVKPQLPKIQLNGIATTPSKIAFLKAQSPAKPGEQPQGEQSYTLGEGQREGGIEILEINEKAGTIRVNNAGTEMTIGFDKDAGKVGGTPPPGPTTSRVPPNIGAKIRSMNPGVSGYQRMIPTTTQVPAQSQPPSAPSAQTPVQPLIQQPNAPAETPMTPEEQAVMRELERAAQAAPAQPR
jgi:hypothetical protein